jgi:hypothetical protein
MTALRVVTVGLSRYRKVPAWDVQEAASSRTKIEKLFQDHGAVPEDWTAFATTTRLDARLDDWTSRADESFVVYWTGHGEYSGDGYLLALANSKKPLNGRNGFSGVRLGEALRDQQRRRNLDQHPREWVLLILDTCGSGPGAWQLWRSFDILPPNIGVIATADEGAAYAGGFAAVLEQVLEGFDGNDAAGIPLVELTRRLRERLEGEGQGKKIYENFWPTATLPLRIDAPPTVQATVDRYAELRDVLSSAPADIRNHFYAKAQGTEIGEPAWCFAGRVAERRTIAAWLRNAPGGMYVVSGVAGSGKSALLGMMLASSDEKVRAAIAGAGFSPIPADLTPGDLTYDAVIHLSGQAVADTVRSLANAMHLDHAEGPDKLIDQVRQRGQHVDRTTMLVDALDEARDPLTIAALLRRLAALPGVRVLVGTRQSLNEDPDIAISLDNAVLDVLAPDSDHVMRLQRDPEAVRTYVSQRLRRAALPDFGEDRADAISDLIAAFPQPFLFARLALHEIIADPAWTAPDADLQKLLGSGHRGIFGQAVSRFANHAPDVEALLHALTYGRGNGFPRTDGVWAAAASALTEIPITDATVERALQQAAPYIMYDSESGQGVYRLAHRTFAEWYRRSDSELKGTGGGLTR